MHIVTVGSLKGGTGKSTLAENLAAQFAHEGHDTLLVDADPVSRTASIWSAERPDDLPRVDCIQQGGKETGAKIKAIAEKYDRVVIDTPGTDGPELRGSLVISDMLIVTARPTPNDAWTVTQMRDILEQAAVLNPSIRAGLVPTQCPSNPQMKDAATFRQYIEESEDYIGLFSAQIANRAAWWRVTGHGLAVFEDNPSPDDPATFEWRRFYREFSRAAAAEFDTEEVE